MVVDGLTAQQIGRRLALSPRTVDNHLSRIRRRFDLPNRAALVTYAHAHGLVAAPAPRPVRAITPPVPRPVPRPPAEVPDPDDLDAALDAELDPATHDPVDDGPPTEPVLIAAGPAEDEDTPDPVQVRRRRLPVLTLVAATLVAVVALTATVARGTVTTAPPAEAPPAVSAPAAPPAVITPDTAPPTHHDDTDQAEGQDTTDAAPDPDEAEYARLHAVARAVAEQARRTDGNRR